MGKGRFILPAEAGMEKELLYLAEKWRADAIRDCDGIKLSDDILNMSFDVYSTLCIIREDNEWAKKNQDKLQMIYLITEPVTAIDEIISIEIMRGYFKEQFKPNTKDNPKEWWEVIDRTTGEIIDSSHWDYNECAEVVTIKNIKKWHAYTVTFLAWQIWEPVSMYDYITNSWTEEHKMPLDPRYPEVRQHLLSILDKWLDEHPLTKVVGFTTFFYNFDLIYNENGKEKQVDWFGYASCVSTFAIRIFEEEYGYKPRPEDFVDNGYFNTPFKNPSKFQLDWIEFNERFVASFAKECVKLVHNRNKKAIMFLGDHFAGTEPYGKYFTQIGLDAVVGSGGDGVTTRMIADIPVEATEIRFYPYLSPDVFYEGEDLTGEAIKVWIKSRRAILRKPIDRMGYGGSLSLALKSPEFINCVQSVANEFRSIHENTKGTKADSASFKVAILNTWGRLRRWQTHQIAHSLWNQRCYSYIGILEALTGLEFDIEFISFDDIKNLGIPQDIKVIINAGDAYTSWSGGDYWKDERVVTAIREWIYNGGGFIGVGDPTACEHYGAFFQLYDVLGVQKEIGFGLSRNKLKYNIVKNHFIIEDMNKEIDFGEGMNSIYVASKNALVLYENNMSASLTVNDYGNGRAVYIAGMPFNYNNVRLLKRAIYWVAHKEEEMQYNFSSNVNVECVSFSNVGKIAVINNNGENEKAKIYIDRERCFDVELKPYEMIWQNLI